MEVIHAYPLALSGSVAWVSVGACHGTGRPDEALPGAATNLIVQVIRATPDVRS
jgi:hypothetical protein